MSSGFVSGGTTDKPVERDNEWLKAQEEIEAIRRRNEESRRQQGGKTLYEVLQANKGDYNGSIKERMMTIVVRIANMSGASRYP
jgi:hypothetical protein